MLPLDEQELCVCGVCARVCRTNSLTFRCSRPEKKQQTSAHAQAGAAAADAAADADADDVPVVWHMCACVRAPDRLIIRSLREKG